MIDTKLLSAIRQSPDDDAPRLVYADWLEERGELPRARLISLQCALAKQPPWQRAAAAARREVDALLCDHGDRWRAELPALDGVRWTAFHRGFVGSARVRDLVALYDHAGAIADAMVTRVELDSCDETEASLPDAGLPWLRALRINWRWRGFKLAGARSVISVPAELEIAVAYSAEADVLGARGDEPLERLVLLGEHTLAGGIVDRLAEMPGARHLRELVIGTSFVDHDTGYYEDPTLRGDGAGQLAAARCDRIEVLDVSRQRVATDGLAAIVGSLPRLRDLAARYCEVEAIDWLATEHGAPIARLDLGGNAIGDDGVRAIAAAPRLQRAGALCLDVCEVTGEGLATLVESPLWHELRELDLSGNPLGPGGAVVLAGAPRPRHLHALRLADVDLDADASAVLAGTPWLDQLAMVDVSRNAVTLALVRALTGVHDVRLCGVTGLDGVASAALGALWQRAWRVDLRGTALGDALLPAGAPELYRLELGGFANDTTEHLDPALVRRLGGGGFAKLRRLDVGGQIVDDAAVAALLDSPLRDQLATLGLDRARLSLASIKRIADTTFARLRVLDLSRNPMEQETLLYVARALPIARVPHVVLANTHWPRTAPTRAELAKRYGESWASERRASGDPEHDERRTPARGGDEDEDE